MVLTLTSKLLRSAATGDLLRSGTTGKPLRKGYANVWVFDPANGQWLGDFCTGNSPRDLARDASGNTYVAGVASLLAYGAHKISPTGNLLWRTDLFTNAYGVAAGTGFTVWATARQGTPPATLWKLDDDGNEIWRLDPYDAGSRGTAARVDSGGNILFLAVGGYYGNNLYLWKMDSGGNLQWSRDVHISPAAYDPNHSMTIDAAGNAYVVGRAWSFSEGEIRKYDPSGGLVLSCSYYGAMYGGNDVAVGPSGNIYITRWCWDLAPVGCVRAHNSTGDVLWTKVGSTNQEYGWGITVDSGENIYFGKDSSLFKLDSSGATIWSRPVSSAGKVASLTFGSNGLLYVISTSTICGTLEGTP